MYKKSVLILVAIESTITKVSLIRSEFKLAVNATQRQVQGAVSISSTDHALP